MCCLCSASKRALLSSDALWQHSVCAMRSALLTFEGAAVTSPLRITYALVYCVDCSAVLVPLLVVQWQLPAESNLECCSNVACGTHVGLHTVVSSTTDTPKLA
jgi:hypothetical protein